MVLSREDFSKYDPPPYAWLKFGGILCFWIGVGIVVWNSHPEINHSIWVRPFMEFLLLCLALVLTATTKMGEFMGKFWDKAVVGTVIGFVYKPDGTVEHFVNHFIYGAGDVVITVPKGLLARFTGTRCFIVDSTLADGAPIINESRHWNVRVRQIEKELQIRLESKRPIATEWCNELDRLAKLVANDNSRWLDPFQLLYADAAVDRLKNKVEDASRYGIELIESADRRTRAALQHFLDTRRVLESITVKRALAELLPGLPAADPLRQEVERKYKLAG